MSSSRSVASARARRAGGDSSTSRPSQIRNTQQFTKPPPAVDNQSSGDKAAAPHDGKLSVSDAFALVTIRLGRVEMALQKLDIHNIAKSVDDGDSSSSIANNVVLKSIISRIDDLEKMISEQSSNVSMSPEYIELINGLQTKMEVQEKELRDTKDAIYKLQSFALDVNQKISQIQVKDKHTDESEEDEQEDEDEEEKELSGEASEESVEEEEQA